MSKKPNQVSKDNSKKKSMSDDDSSAKKQQPRPETTKPDSDEVLLQMFNLLQTYMLSKGTSSLPADMETNQQIDDQSVDRSEDGVDSGMKNEHYVYWRFFYHL